MTLKISLKLLPPSWESMEKAERELSRLVQGHLVLVLATLLGESTNPLMNPFITINFGLLRRDRGSGDDLIDVFLCMVVSVMVSVYGP